MAASYWLRLGRRTEGPLALDELRRRACRGSVTPAHSISRDGTTWMAARRCAEIFGTDGMPIAPGGAGPLDAGLEDAHVEDGWDLQSVAVPDPDAAHGHGGAAVRRQADTHVAAWPAHLACAVTLALACALPMARDSNGPIWWWHVVRVWDLAGAGPVTAAVAWAIVSASAVASSVALWTRGGPGRMAVLTASAIASMVLASAAWGAGMACGVWTLPQCAMIPVVLLACCRSAERPQAARAFGGASHRLDGSAMAAAAIGALSVVLGVVALLVRDGGAAVAASILMAVGGAAMVGNAIRWRAAGPDEWTTLVPAGAAVFACGAILCDGVAALAATPVPPVEGTRFAVMDAVRVMCVLLCQCGLAYLAHREHDAGPPSHLAYAPAPGNTDS